jgi:hypothetical protein
MGLESCLPLHQVGLVLDLTNSSRYYRFHDEVPDHERRQIFYKKVGREQTLACWS